MGINTIRAGEKQCKCQILNPLSRDELVSVLHRTSMQHRACTALISTHDTSESEDSGASDNGPVLAQHAEQEALALDRERFTQTRRSCLEPDRSVGKVPVGEPSLSGEPECLSLYATILAQQEKAEMAPQPPKPQRRTRHSSRPVNGDGHPASIFVKRARYFVAGFSHGTCAMMAQ